VVRSFAFVVCVFLYSSPLIALCIQLGQSVQSAQPDGSSKMQQPSRHEVARHNSSVCGQVVQRCRVFVFLYSSPLIALRIQLGQSVQSAQSDGSSKMQQPSRHAVACRNSSVCGQVVQHCRVFVFLYSSRLIALRIQLGQSVQSAQPDGSSKMQQPSRHAVARHNSSICGQVVCICRLCLSVLIPTDSLVHSTGAISAVCTTRRKQQNAATK
jgi:hypothetical protein